MNHIGTPSFTCPTFVQRNTLSIHPPACIPRTESIPSRLNFVVFLPTYKTCIQLVFLRPTRHTCIPLTFRPSAIFITFLLSKQKPRENVSQRWFLVFAYFSQRRLTYYRSPTDTSTPNAATSPASQPVCKTATSRIACLAEDTSTPLVIAAFWLLFHGGLLTTCSSPHRMQVPTV